MYPPWCVHLYQLRSLLPTLKKTNKNKTKRASVCSIISYNEVNEFFPVVGKFQVSSWDFVFIIPNNFSLRQKWQFVHVEAENSICLTNSGLMWNRVNIVYKTYTCISHRHLYTRKVESTHVPMTCVSCFMWSKKTDAERRHWRKNI